MQKYINQPMVPLEDYLKLEKEKRNFEIENNHLKNYLRTINLPKYTYNI